MHGLSRAPRAAYIPGSGKVKEEPVGLSVELLGKSERLNVPVLHCDDGRKTVARKLCCSLLCALLVKVEGMHMASRCHSARQRVRQ